MFQLVNRIKRWRATLFNVRIVTSSRVLQQPRSFFFGIYKQEYERYKKWIEPALPSLLPIDIIIPAIDKDLDTLAHVISAARKHIKHPVQNIYIVAPASPAIMACAAQAKCIFVNEKDVCGITKQQIDFTVNGVSRSGWIYQQLLKFNFDKVGTCEHHLVLDADTVFVRPTSFEAEGKFYFDFSDEYHTPYYTAYEIVTGLKHKLPVSFVSHYMLFSKKKLQSLKAHIQTHTGKSTEQAIIDLKLTIMDQSVFSEYETYANFCLHTQPNSYRVRYWFNKNLDATALKTEVIDSATAYRSLSFHNYNQQ